VWTLIRGCHEKGNVTTAGKSGTLASVTDARSAVTSYSYDAKGNMTGITPPAGVALKATMTVDTATSRTTSKLDGNQVTTSYTYDTLDRVKTLTYTKTGQTTKTITNTYDDIGNMTSLAEGSATTSYGFDPLNRVTSKQLPGGVGAITATFDGSGNLLSQSQGTDTTSYAYDVANNLTTLTLPGGGTPVTFTYDNNDRRLTTTYPGNVTQTQAYDASGRLTSIVGKTGTTTRTSFAYSHKIPGTTTDRGQRYTMTDMGGNVTTYSYDPYGKQTTSSGTVANPFRFGAAYGAYTDEGNLVKIGERYYDAGMGRWTQTDPLGGGYGYGYVGGNPINSIDPTGLFEWELDHQWTGWDLIVTFTVGELKVGGAAAGLYAVIAAATGGVGAGPIGVIGGHSHSRRRSVTTSGIPIWYWSSR